MKEVKRVIGIKCFNMDLTCRGYQFEIGKSYEIQGELEMCKNGFHFHHHNQLEHVFDYYDKVLETRYCLVIGEDIIMDNDKTVARKIIIVKELSLQEVIDIRHRKMVKQGKFDSQDEDEGVASQTRDCGIASQTGYRGSAMQTGDCGLAGQTGYQGSAYQIGYQGLSGQTGDYGISSQTGYRGSAIQTGDCGSAIQDGENGIAMAMGIEGRAMVKNNKGAIVIQNWVSNNYGCYHVKNGLYARVGDLLPNGEIMATNTWYWYEDGELNSRRDEK